MKLEIVTPDRTVYSQENIDMVITHAAEGEIGILPKHTPLLSTLEPTIVRIKKAEAEQKMAVSGGFLEVRPDHVIILAEAAELAEEIDQERAKAAQARAENRINQSSGEVDYERAQAALSRAINRLQLK